MTGKLLDCFAIGRQDVLTDENGTEHQGPWVRVDNIAVQLFGGEARELGIRSWVRVPLQHALEVMLPVLLAALVDMAGKEEKA